MSLPFIRAAKSKAPVIVFSSIMAQIALTVQDLVLSFRKCRRVTLIQNKRI